MAQQLTSIPATISRVNDTGFQTQEDPGRWFTVSRFAKPAPTIPPRGTPCRIIVDDRGFVSRIEPLDPSPEPPPDAAQNAPKPLSGSTGAAPAREVVIRLEVLKAAVAFCASRPEAKCGDVLTVAQAWEVWVTR
jgi:hypothetical protein